MGLGLDLPTAHLRSPGHAKNKTKQNLNFGKFPDDSYVPRLGMPCLRAFLSCPGVSRPGSLVQDPEREAGQAALQRSLMRQSWVGW